MKTLLIALAAGTLLAASDRPSDAYRPVTAQVAALSQASGCEALATRRLTISQAMAFYDRVAKSCGALRERLWQLDVALMNLVASTPASPLDTRMREVRGELARQLAAVCDRNSTRDSGAGAARQADLIEMARLTRLIHLVDMEIAEAATRRLADSKDSRIAADLQVLRHVEVRVANSEADAAAMVEAIRQTARRRIP